MNLRDNIKNSKTQPATASQAALTTQTVTTTQAAPTTQTIATDECDATVTMNKHGNLTLNSLYKCEW